MAKSRNLAPELPPLKLVDVERREYGRRYSWLPVDSIDRNGLIIECSDTYMRPHMYDVRVGDTVRWLHDGQRLQATIRNVERTSTRLLAHFTQVTPLPADFFAF